MMMSIEQLYHTVSTLLAVCVSVGIPAVIVFKMVKKKTLPKNHYTPYDDLLQGKKPQPGPEPDKKTYEVVEHDQRRSGGARLKKD
jgi:hypothetical protein